MYATLSRLAKAYTFKGHEKMTEQLQNDEYVEETEVEDIQSEEVHESESSELATDSDAEHEEKPDDEAAAKLKRDTATNEAFNKQHRKYQDEKRRADELEQRLTQLAPKQQTPQLLEEPDPFDDDFANKQAAYIASVRNVAQFDYAQEQNQHNSNLQQANAQQARQQALEVKGNEFSKRAKDSGITDSEMTQAVQTVVNSGMNGEVGEYILDSADGPLITTFLATNLVEMEKINAMAPIQAAMYIEQSIKPKAAELKPKITNAPSPVTKIAGGAIKPEGFKYLDGATFE